MAKKLTQEEFLEKVKRCNNNDIDYSNFVYNGNNKPSKCKCNVCGHEWEPVPMSLFTGHGCPKCAIEYKARKLSKPRDKAIEDFKKVHGDRYIYDNINYINKKEEIEVICRIHGPFNIKPFMHLNGHGCKKCAKSGIKLSQEEFEQKVNEKLPTIDLSEFEYVNCTTPSKCKCKTCGYEWEASYVMLINSSIGCPSCALKSRVKKRTDTLEKFITKLKSRYPNIDYDFSKSVYVSSLTKMDVICPKHGKFEIKPNDLMNGIGCSRCNDSHLEKEVRDKLNELNIDFVQGKYHKWLLNEGTNHPLTLDFYLPNEKIAIECQGIQHFEALKHFGGKSRFEYRKSLDVKKKQLCKDNGVKLLYYLDKEYNKFMNEDDIYFNDVNEMAEYVSNAK
jgi:hypothetical protein